MTIHMKDLKRMADNGYGEWLKRALPQLKLNIERKEYDIIKAEKKIAWLKESIIRDREQFIEHHEELRIIEEEL